VYQNDWNRFIFDRVILKNKKGDVFIGHSVCASDFHNKTTHRVYVTWPISTWSSSTYRRIQTRCISRSES